MKTTFPRFATVVVALLVLSMTACGSSKKATSTTKSTATTISLETKGPGSCKVDMTGSVSHTIKGKGGVAAVGSDYWYSTPKLQSALDSVGSESESSTSAGSAAQKVANGDFVITGLVLNCFEKIGDHYSVNFTTTSGADRTNFPFAPADYKLTGDPSNSVLNVTVSAGSRKIWKVTTGELKITTFDSYEVGGTFTVDATEDTFGQGGSGTLHAEGTFTMPCAAGDKCDSIDKKKATTTSEVTLQLQNESSGSTAATVSGTPTTTY